MTTAWAHLPNAALIDWVMADVKERPQVWAAARTATRGAAWDAARTATRGAAWDAAWDAAWTAARESSRFDPLFSDPKSVVVTVIPSPYVLSAPSR